MNGFDTDIENKVPGQLLASELESNKIQDGGGRHIENHIFSHNSANIKCICTEFETQAENGGPADRTCVSSAGDKDQMYYWGKDALAQEVYMHAGHSGKCVTRERFIPVHHISTKLGKAVCKCQPAMHALSCRLRHHECSVQSWKANSIFGSRQECGGSTETGNIP